MAVKTLMTIEQLKQLPEGDDLTDRFYELDEGELIEMAPAASGHGRVEAGLVCELGIFVKTNARGVLYTSDTGFVLSRNPDTVLSPDVAFVRKERAEAADEDEFFEGAPDLAVEIFSKSDTVPRVMRKVLQYLQFGTQTVWVVYPKKKQVHVFEASGTDRLLSKNELLEAPELLPGFSIGVNEIFES